jgi:hypothetical protein
VAPSSPHCTTLSSETLPEAVFPVQLVLSNLTST